MDEHESHQRLESPRDKYFGKSPSMIQILKENEEKIGCESDLSERESIERMVMEASEDFNQIRESESTMLKKSSPYTYFDLKPNSRHVCARELSSQTIHTPQMLSPPSPIRKTNNAWDVGISERWNISETKIKSWKKEIVKTPNKVILNSKTIDHEIVNNFDSNQNDMVDPLHFLFRRNDNEGACEQCVSEIGSEDSSLPPTPPRVRRKPWHNEKMNHDNLNRSKFSTWLPLEPNPDILDVKTPTTREGTNLEILTLEQKTFSSEIDEPLKCKKKSKEELNMKDQSYTKSSLDTSTPIFGENYSDEDVIVKSNTNENSINEDSDERGDGNLEKNKTGNIKKWSTRYEQKKTKIYFSSPTEESKKFVRIESEPYWKTSMIGDTFKNLSDIKLSPNISLKHYIDEDQSLVEVSLSNQKCMSYALWCLCFIMIISLFIVIIINIARPGAYFSHNESDF